jgi:hypothetical protein
MTNTNEPLDRELTFYEQHKTQWVRDHENEFVVIAGENIGGFYPSYEAAFDAGARQFGAEAIFLIKQICSVEPVYYVY